MNLEQEEVHTSVFGVEIFEAPLSRRQGPVLQLNADECKDFMREQTTLVYAWMHAKPVETFFDADKPEHEDRWWNTPVPSGEMSMATLMRGSAARDMFWHVHPDTYVAFAGDVDPPHSFYVYDGLNDTLIPRRNWR